MTKKTLEFLRSLQQSNGSFRGWPGGPEYPEITGYLIPTLLDYGDREMAERAADYLVGKQNADGSFNGVDGVPAAFDTGACMEGLREIGRWEAAARAEKWIHSQSLNEVYHARVRGLLGMDGPRPSRWAGLRSHYWAYALEGAAELGDIEFVEKELKKLPRGMQPYYLDGADDTDTCATAQVAKLRLLCGFEADQEIDLLRSLVADDGSLPHGLNNPKKVAWACKYYLDAEFLLAHLGTEDAWYRVREWQFRQFSISKAVWDAPHPFGISGCFRVRNDHEFLWEAVTSHLPYLDEAVIALQPSDAETNAVVARLAAEFPDKVRVENYPVAPVFITDPEWPNVPVNSIRSFVYLSNFALSKCKYSWIARVEADVIGLSSFARIRERIENEPEKKILYGRVILNVAGEHCEQISATVPRNGGWDESVFPNHPSYRFVRRPRYEVIETGEFPLTQCLGFSALHMKRCKRDKIGWNNEEYAPFTPEGVAQALAAFNNSNPYPGPDNPLGEPCLFERNPL